MGGATSRRRLLTGICCAAGAFGVTAFSTVGAPTARADDFTDVINAAEGDFTAAQADFTAAVTDFDTGNISGGLAEFFSGVDDETLSAPYNLILGTADLLEYDTVPNSFIIGPLPVETTFASGLADAEQLFADAQPYFNESVTYLLNGDYVYAAGTDFSGLVYDVAGVQLLLEGLVGSLTTPAI